MAKPPDLGIADALSRDSAGTPGVDQARCLINRLAADDEGYVGLLAGPRAPAEGLTWRITRVPILGDYLVVTKIVFHLAYSTVPRALARAPLA
jgi:hypothetical protein